MGSQTWDEATDRMADEVSMNLLDDTKDVFDAVTRVRCSGIDDGGYERQKFTRDELILARHDLESAEAHIEDALSKIPDVSSLSEAGTSRTLSEWKAQTSHYDDSTIELGLTKLNELARKVDEIVGELRKKVFVPNSEIDLLACRYSPAIQELRDMATKLEAVCQLRNIDPQK